jgi:hypothetical protein
MPKLSEIELRPNDIPLTDVPDDLIARLHTRATALGMSFSEQVFTLLADYCGVPPEERQTGTTLVLHPE